MILLQYELNPMKYLDIRVASIFVKYGYSTQERQEKKSKTNREMF